MQQADILFLGVAHGADQRVQRGVQHRSLGAAQNRDVIAARHSGRLQKGGGLAGQPVVQRAHLAAEPRNAALGGGVGVLQRRDGIMPDAVARIDVLVVRLIPNIVLPQRGTVCLGVGAGQAEAGPHIAAAARRNAGQPVQTRAARHAEKHRLSLVGHRVGRGNDGLLPRGQLIEPAVAQTAGPILARAGRHLYAFLHGVIQEQLHAVPAAEVRHKVGIAAGSLAPDAVVDVGRQHLDFQRTAMAQ